MVNESQREKSALRIVEIQNSLRPGDPALQGLLAEQRTLWDRDHAGRAFDEIAHDVWLVKVRSKYD